MAPSEARLRQVGSLKGSMVVLSPENAVRFRSDAAFREGVLRDASDHASCLGTAVDVYGSGATCFLLEIVEPRASGS
jgi:hypothetical protein